MSNSDSKIEQVMIKYLTTNGVFFASLLSQMSRVMTTRVGPDGKPKPIVNVADSVDTCAVTVKNGRLVLYWNKEFFENLDINTAMADLEHECLHLVMDHISRREGRDPKLWNQATDLAINQLITGLQDWTINLKQFPEDWKMPPKATAETYYDIMYKNADRITYTVCKGDKCKEGSCGQKQQGQGQGDKQQKGQGQQPGQGKGQKQSGKGQGQGDQEGDGEGQPQPGDGEGGKKIHVKITDSKGNVKGEYDIGDPCEQDKWENADNQDIAKEVIKQAVQKAKEESDRMAGNMPGSLDEYIKDLLTPPVIPWQAVLRRFVANSVKAGHKKSWKKPSRRYGENQKGQLPARQMKLTIGIDTSGSITDDNLQAFVSELRAIQRSYKSKITMIEIDYIVQREYNLDRYTAVKTNFQGRGGTSFVPLFEYVTEKKIKTDALIYFTDLYGDFPKTKPPYPVLWVSVGGKIDGVPFGEVLDMDAGKPKRRY